MQDNSTLFTIIFVVSALVGCCGLSACSLLLKSYFCVYALSRKSNWSLFVRLLCVINNIRQFRIQDKKWRKNIESLKKNETIYLDGQAASRINRKPGRNLRQCGIGLALSLHNFLQLMLMFVCMTGRTEAVSLEVLQIAGPVRPLVAQRGGAAATARETVT